VGFRDWFRLPAPYRPSEQRDLLTSSWSATAIPTNYDGHGADSGEWVSERNALHLIPVQACIRLLADSVAGLPVDVYRKQGDVRVPLATPAVLTDPDVELNALEVMHQVVTSLAARGNSYELITSRDGLERPLSRVPVHPDDVHVDRDSATGRRAYRIHGKLVPSADIIHIRRMTLPGSLTGLSPIGEARQAIGVGLAAERYGARWFGDSANPSSVLETDANLDDDESLRVMRAWVDSHGGRRHPALLSGGLSYRPISITPEESQFLATRQFQRSEIAMLYGIPPHMIGDTEKTTSWGTGIEQQSLGFVKFTLMPWLRTLEAAYSRVLLPRGQYMRFNLEGLLRADVKTRYDAYAQARTAGWMSVNEIRALEDLDNIGPDGDSFVQPLNFGPLGSDPLATKQQGGQPQ
jgi:HK97 family phage portal protein